MRYFVLEHRVTGIKIVFPENYFKENYNENTDQLFFAVYGKGGKSDRKLFLKVSDYNLTIRNNLIKY